MIKESVKRILAAATAAVMCFTSVFSSSAAATVTPSSMLTTYSEGDNGFLTINFLHGTTGTYWQGYDFRNSGLVIPGGGHLTAGNFVEMNYLEKDANGNYVLTATKGAVADAQIAYCVGPTSGILASTYVSSTPSGYGVTETTNISACTGDVGELSDAQILALRTVLTYGYTGRIRVKYGYNERYEHDEWQPEHDSNNLTGIKYAQPMQTALDHFDGDYTKAAWASRVATQLMVWFVVLDWYHSAEEVNKAFAAFTGAMKRQESPATIELLAKLCNELFTQVYNVQASGGVASTNDYGTFFNSTANPYRGDIDDSDVATFNIPYNRAVANDMDNGKIDVIGDIQRALVEAGIAAADIKVTDNRIKNRIEVEISNMTTNGYADGVLKNTIQLDLPSVNAGGLYEVYGLHNAANQSAIVASPSSSIYLGLEDIPTKLRVVKRFNGALGDDTPGVNMSEFDFYIFGYDEGTGTMTFINFAQNLEGVYEYTGETNTDVTAFAASPLRLNADSTFSVDLENVPKNLYKGDGKGFYIVETNAQTGWDTLLNSAQEITSEFYKPISGSVEPFYFDNVSDGTGLLFFRKRFYSDNGTEFTADSQNAKHVAHFRFGAQNAQFTIVDKDGVPVTATGTAGKYTYDLAGTVTTFKLDPITATFYINNMPTGTYYIQEVAPVCGFDDAGWNFDYKSAAQANKYKTTACVLPITDASMSIDDRIAYVGTKGYEATIKNVWIPPTGDVLLVKTSENNKVDNFTFYIESERQDDANSTPKTAGTTGPLNYTSPAGATFNYAHGAVVFKNLPTKYSDGTPATYKITEDNTTGLAIAYKELIPVTGIRIKGDDVVVLGKEQGIVNYLKKASLEIYKKADDEDYGNAEGVNVLANIPFKVEALDATNNVLATYDCKTDNMGYAEISELPVYHISDTNVVTQIRYKVTELPPQRYVLVPEQITVLDPDAFETQLVFSNKRKTADFHLTKWADDFEIEGIEFVMSDATGIYKQSATTTAAGVCTFTNMPIYDSNNQLIVYTISEQSPKADYLTPADLTNITLQELGPTTPYGANTAQFDNISKKAALKVVKKNAEGTPLKGATFKVFEEAEYDAVGLAAKAVDYAITQEDGIAVFEPLKVNKAYVAVETNAPVGYSRTIEPYRFTITEADAIVGAPATARYTYLKTYEWKEDYAVTLKVIKKDDVTDAPLIGAVFDLVDAAGKSHGVKLTSNTNGEDGSVTYDNLEDGVYTLTEVSAPYGYAVSPDSPWTITINSADVELNAQNKKVIEKEVPNTEVLPGGVIVYKVDKDTGEPLAGAKFAIYKADGSAAKDTHGNTFGLATTDAASGKAKFADVPAGSYIIVEADAPAGYVKSDEVIEFTVEEGDNDKTFSFVVENAKSVDNPLRILKVDGNTNEPLAGAEFWLYDEEGYPISTATSDANGIAEFNVNIDFDVNYTIREFKAPTTGTVNYVKQPKAIELTLTKGAGTDVIVSANYEGETDTLTGSGTKNGAATGSLADAKEALTASLKGTKKAVSVDYKSSADGGVVGLRVENYPESVEGYGKLTIVKTSTDNVINGFRFTVIADEKDPATGEFKSYSGVTQPDGTLSFESLPVYNAYGDKINYTIRETTRDGYAALEDITDVNLVLNDVVIANVLNIQTDDVGDIEVIKTADDDKVEGRVFIAKSSDNKTYISDPTDAVGYTKFRNLPIKNDDGDLITYTVSEVQDEDEGYVILGPVVLPNIYKDVAVPVDFHNTHVDSEVRLIKVDENGAALAGAEFSLYKDANCTQLVSTKTTAVDNDAASPTYGKAIVKFTTGLSTSQTYYLKETLAPIGYAKSNDIFECAIDENGDATYRIYNSGDAFSAAFPVCQNVLKSDNEEARIIKTDEAGARLEGAQFGLYSDVACKNLIATSTSTTDNDAASATYGKAVVKFEVVRGKTYYIKETKAPDGYDASTNVYKAVVNGDGTVMYSIAGTNEEFATFPVCKNYKNATNSVRLIKIDANGARLEGAQFGLYTDEACTKLINAATAKIDNAAGSPTYGMAIVRFDAERDTTYYMKETAAPTGYEKSTTVFKAVVDNDGNVKYSILGAPEDAEMITVTGTGFDFTFPACVNFKSVTPPTNEEEVETPDNPTFTPPATPTVPTTTTTATTTTKTTPKKTTTVKDVNTPDEVDTPAITTTVTTTRPPTTTTKPRKTYEITEDDDVPDTGVALDFTAGIALALISGALSTICLVNGFKKRKEEEPDNKG